MNEDSTIKFTDFDYLTGDHHLQMMKAALPYVNAPSQRILSILVKLQELRRTIALFDSGENAAVGIMSLGEAGRRSPLDMLNAIRPFAGRQEQDSIDLVCNLLEGFRIGSQYQQDMMMQEAGGMPSSGPGAGTRAETGFGGAPGSVPAGRPVL